MLLPEMAMNLRQKQRLLWAWSLLMMLLFSTLNSEHPHFGLLVIWNHKRLFSNPLMF